MFKSALDVSGPVEIAPEVFWVGSHIKGDIFQCHNYLIRDGSESILIDPGSLITFKESLKKIKYLVDLRDIKYFICHHQDPDVTASLPKIAEVFPRTEKFIVTHWRTYFLLKHYNLPFPFYLVDQHDYELVLSSGRRLKFILTPYMHYPGNIVTYDESSKVLFSSDIFGAWDDNWRLFADESYIEKMRAFHEIYMPSKEIVLFSLNRLKDFDIRVIAPQHGSIISNGRLIYEAFKALEDFDYGVLMEVSTYSEVKRLYVMKSILKSVEKFAMDKLSLSEVVPFILDALKTAVSVEDILVKADCEEGRLLYSVSRGYELTEGEFEEVHGEEFVVENDVVVSVKFVASRISQPHRQLLEDIARVIHATAKRDMFIRSIKKSVDFYKELALKDTLTGCYRKEILDTLVEVEFYNSKRYQYPLSCLMVDIDDFKSINDGHGHIMGDRVLRKVGEFLSLNLRKGDILVRYGGDEFLIFLPHIGLAAAKAVAERIRKFIESSEIEGLRITVSVGVAESSFARDLEDLIEAADEALYKAKRAGKNRVEVFAG
ncbi:MAG: diguanylate cyclase [Deferribacteres bacterium]|nr:diguanylate cyclase [Deferribacteres bacterium]